MIQEEIIDECLLTLLPPGLQFLAPLCRFQESRRRSGWAGDGVSHPKLLQGLGLQGFIKAFFDVGIPGKAEEGARSEKTMRSELHRSADLCLASAFLEEIIVGKVKEDNGFTMLSSNSTMQDKSETCHQD